MLKSCSCILVKLVSVGLAAAFLMSGCSKALRQDDDYTNAAQITNGYVNDLSVSAKKGLYQSTNTDIGYLSQMTLTLSNQYLELYIGKYRDIAIYDKETGGVFFSNRAIYDTSVNSQLTDEGFAETYSQLTLNYYDDADKSYMLTSYPDSISDLKDQTSLDVSDNEVTVTYDFGKKNLDGSICSAFTVADYNQIDKLANQKIDSNKIDIVGYARFQNAYADIKLSDLTGSDKSTYLKKYPALKTYKELYILKDDVTDVDKTLVFQISQELGIDKDYIINEKKKIGSEQNPVSNAMFFEIPVVYKLDGRDLIASVNTRGINSSGDYKLTRVNLLSNFGAAMPNQSGYLFIPDESGAVIENNTATQSQANLEVPFYGSDFCIDNTNGGAIEPYSSMPVFGIKSNTQAVFGVVESGEAAGGVTAQVPNGVNPYDIVQPWFNYYVKDTDTNGNYIFSKKQSDVTFQIRYHFLYGNDSTYAGMARYYQKYLLQTGQLKKHTLETGTPLNVSFIGAITKKQFICGIPVNALTAASKTEDIQKFTESLNSKGVQNVNYVLLGAVNGGMDFKIPSKLHIENVIGGENGYASLANSIKKSDGTLNLSIDFTKVYKNGNGLNQNRDISRYIGKQVAYMAGYDPYDLQKAESHYAYMINPVSYLNIVYELIQSEKQSDRKSIYVDSIGSYLSGNYNDHSFCSRQQSEYEAGLALKTLKNAGYRITVDGGNLYTLKYADFVDGVPVDNGGYSLESYAVPFVGMVLHGLIDYTGPALNQQGDYEKALLQTVESGAGLNYLLMTQNPLLMTNTDYTNYYNVSSSYWTSEIISAYSQINSSLASLKDCTIVDNYRVSPNVFVTEYSDGSIIVINYNSSPVRYEHYEVNGMSYLKISK